MLSRRKSPGKDESNGKVLFVDDEESILKSIQRSFFLSDFEVLTACGAEKGLEILTKETVDIVVSDFGGNLDVSNMGGQSCTVAKSCGIIGAIVNGAVRDVPSIKKLDFPVWSRGKTPITGKFRLEAIEINGPVTLHDVVVYPGDLVQTINTVCPLILVAIDRQGFVQVAQRLVELLLVPIDLSHVGQHQGDSLLIVDLAADRQ